MKIEIEVGENPTNGDILKALFPAEGDFETDFDEKWWNAPYNQEQIKQEYARRD